MKKRIRPDIVIDWSDEIGSLRYIVDTKWKIPKANRPSDDDLKQMYVYNLQFGAKQSALLYPSTESSEPSNGSYCDAPGFHGSTEQHSGLYFAELFTPNEKLNNRIGFQTLNDLGVELLETATSDATS